MLEASTQSLYPPSDDDVISLAVEEDGQHDFAHFPHCKVYLTMTLGLVFIVTLMVPLGIAYARPALTSYDLLPAQCHLKSVSHVSAKDTLLGKTCPSFDVTKGLRTGPRTGPTASIESLDCLLSRATCDFSILPLCFQKDCRCIQINVTANLGKEKAFKQVTLYVSEDTYLYYPSCSINPCAEDEVFEDMLNRLRDTKGALRCFFSPKRPNAAIYKPIFRDQGLTLFGTLVLPLVLLVTWVFVFAYVIKRTWRVTRRDFKQAVEFRFASWPPRPSHTVNAAPHYATSYS